VDQPPAVAFTAFADAWPKAIETEIDAALCAIGRGKGHVCGLPQEMMRLGMAKTATKKEEVTSSPLP